MLRKFFLPLAMTLTCWISLSGCTTFQNDGRLVRHHIGYARIITPLAYSQGEEIRVLEVSNFGLWAKNDSRSGPINEGSGIGMGAIYTRRESIPLSCSFVIRLNSDHDLTETTKILNQSFKGMNPCIIQDSEMPLSSLAAHGP